MAGTDHRRQAVTDGPAIILVEPQLGGEFGTNAIGLAETALAPRRRPRGDPLLDPLGVGFRAALQPVERRLAEQAHQLTAGFERPLQRGPFGVRARPVDRPGELM